MEHFLNSLFILLIEPSSSQRKIVVNQFEELGVSQYETVETGQEALDIIDAEQPDLVISSMFLEDMTGKEVVLDMRANPISQDIPFMLISTETSFAELNPIKQAGASAVLPKPFEVRDLKRAIYMIMEWDNPEQVEFVTDGINILVVDDSTMALHLITRTLSKMGFDNIATADNGRQAVTLIQKQKFDLIITDYNMPEMDGHELLKYIRKESTQSNVPVMMVTTEGDESKLSAVQHEGVSAIMDKPFEVKAVKRMLESVFLSDQ